MAFDILSPCICYCLFYPSIQNSPCQIIRMMSHRKMIFRQYFFYQQQYAIQIYRAVIDTDRHSRLICPYSSLRSTILITLGLDSPSGTKSLLRFIIYMKSYGFQFTYQFFFFNKSSKIAFIKKRFLTLFSFSIEFIMYPSCFNEKLSARFYYIINIIYNLRFLLVIDCIK